MPDKKLTDSEIVKAFECCYLSKPCEECPLKDEKDKEGPCFDGDIYALPRMMVELNNRLQEENERLKGISDNKTKELLRYNASIEELHKKLETAKAEAVKEFAERLKEDKEVVLVGSSGNHYRITDKEIDNLLKEMVGEDK